MWFSHIFRKRNFFFMCSNVQVYIFTRKEQWECIRTNFRRLKRISCLCTFICDFDMRVFICVNVIWMLYVCSVVNLLNSLLLQKFDIWFYLLFTFSKCWELRCQNVTRKEDSEMKKNESEPIDYRTSVSSKCEDSTILERSKCFEYHDEERVFSRNGMHLH